MYLYVSRFSRLSHCSVQKHTCNNCKIILFTHGFAMVTIRATSFYITLQTQAFGPVNYSNLYLHIYMLLCIFLGIG